MGIVEAAHIQHSLDDRIYTIRTNVERWTRRHPEETAIGRIVMVFCVRSEGPIPFFDESPLHPFRHMHLETGSIGAEKLTAMVKAKSTRRVIAGGAVFSTSVRRSAPRSSPALVEQIDLDVVRMRRAVSARTKESRRRAGTRDASPYDGHLQTRP